MNLSETPWKLKREMDCLWLIETPHRISNQDLHSDTQRFPGQAPVNRLCAFFSRSHLRVFLQQLHSTWLLWVFVSHTGCFSKKFCVWWKKKIHDETSNNSQAARYCADAGRGNVNYWCKKDGHKRNDCHPVDHFFKVQSYTVKTNFEFTLDTVV